MYCEYCGTKLNKKDKYCSSCGKETIKIDDEDLRKAYIGNNYEKLSNDGFSFCTLLFGAMYLLYRKEWFIGISLIVFNTVIEYFLEEYSLIVTLTLLLFISLIFKGYYIKKVDKKINDIKKKNPSKSNEELIQICRKSGGVTFVPIVITIIASFILFVFLYIIFAFIIGTEQIKDPESNNYKIKNGIIQKF